jgi:hypothetical protein
MPYYRMSTLKKEGTCTSETLVTTHQIKERLVQKIFVTYSSETFECM